MGKNEPDILGQAVIDVLERIPEIWQEYRPDDLTNIQSKTLGLLVGAGMVEGRDQFRLEMHTHPIMAEATIMFTGEYGFVEAIEPLIASLWVDWEESFRQWKDSDTSNAPFGHCERLEPSEWRLTDQGLLARHDIQGDQRDTAVDFVLKRNFFDGQSRLLQEGKVTQREIVRGYGKLVKMKKKQADTTKASGNTGTVNLGNWGEGADALAKVFAPMLEEILKSAQACHVGPVGAIPESGLSARAVRAWMDYQDAIGKGKFINSPPNDREVWEWILCHRRKGENLPKFKTWQRYIREARKFHGCQKNTPRSSREFGGSIATQNTV